MLEFVFDSEIVSRLSKSFKAWPHTVISFFNRKHENITAEKLAQAGFMCSPTVKGSDNAICPWCLVSLDGWEKSDIPMYIVAQCRDEHLKRGKDCVYLKGM
jgi:hypothetical protein